MGLNAAPICGAVFADAEVALAAIAEPSEAMIEAIKLAWQAPHASISDTGARVIWRAAHAAMMAEKDEA